MPTIVFAIASTLLLSLVVLAPTVQIACANACSSYSYDYPQTSAPSIDDSEEITQDVEDEVGSSEPLTIDDLHNIGHRVETHSFYTPVDPYLVNVLNIPFGGQSPEACGQDSMVQNDTSQASQPCQGEQDYWNSNIFGRYRFSADDFARLILLDSTSQPIVSAWFDVESDLGLELGEAAVTSRSETGFSTVQNVSVGGESAGEFHVLTEFNPADKPKITALMRSDYADEMQISWNIMSPHEGIRYSGVVFNASELAAIPEIAIDDYYVGLGDVQGDSVWRGRAIVDWSDAQCGRLTIGNSDSGTLAKVTFPMGMSYVDPTVVATSFFQSATSGSPFRNTVYCGGSYWLFYSDYGISYVRSDDNGVSWSRPISVEYNSMYPERPGMFDVAVQNTQVAIAWMQRDSNDYYGLYYMDGYVTGASISWNFPRLVAVVTATEYGWFGGVTLGVDGSAYTCYAQRHIFDADVRLTTLKKPAGSSVFSEFTNGFPAIPVSLDRIPFIRPMAVTTSSNSIVFTAMIGYELPDEGSSILTVTSPDGGELWMQGTSQYITWDSEGSGTDYVKLQLYQSGSPVYTITPSCSNVGSYRWTVSSQVAPGQYVLRITDTENLNAWDESDGLFTIILPTMLRVASPNGGEIWGRGMVYPVTWATVYTGVSASIQLVEVGTGQRWNIGTVPDASVGKFSWMIPSTQGIGSDYQIWVYISGTYDCSDSWFSIVDIPKSLKLLYPNGDEQLERGRTYNLKWESDGTIVGGDVKIELYSGSENLESIADTTENDGKYEWTVGSGLLCGNNFRVKVTSLSDTGIYDYSDAYFGVTSFIQPDRVDESIIVCNIYRPDTSSWQTPSFGAIQTDCLSSVDYFSICPGEKDEIHIAYLDSSGTLTYKRWGYGDWGDPLSLDAVNVIFPSISVDVNGDVHVQYVSDDVIWEKHTSPGDGAWSEAAKFESPGYYGISCFSSGEKLETRNFVSFTDVLQSPNQIMFGAMPLPADITGPYGDPWSAGGINEDQPFGMGVTDIISPGNGLLYLFQNDFVVPGRGTDMVVSHFYSTPQYFVMNSAGTLVPYLYYTFPFSDVGEGWQLNLPWIDKTYIHLWSGTRVKLQWVGNYFNNTQGQPFQLERQTDGYQLDLQDGMRVVFDSDGAPSKIYSNRDVDKVNADVTLTYNAIATGKRLYQMTDHLGRSIVFAHDSDGMLVSIAWGTNVVSFGHVNSLLVGVSDPTGRTTSFSYCGTGYPSMLVDSVIYPASSAGTYQIDYSYDPIDVGVDALAYVVDFRDVYYEGYKSYSYMVSDGIIRCTTIDDWSLDPQLMCVGETVYNFDSDAKASTVTYFGLDSYEYPYGTEIIPLKRTISRYSPDGRASTSETYYDFKSEPDTFTSYSDSRGNTVYSKDSIGHEVFSSYSNTTTRNAFYRPAQLEKSVSGKIMYDDFNDWYVDGWIESGGGYSTVGTYLSNGSLDPSCKIRATSSAYTMSADLDSGGPGLISVRLDCLLEIETTDSDMGFLLTNEAGVVLTGIRFCFSTLWNTYYIFYLRDDGIWDSTSLKYMSDVLYRVTLVADMSSASVGLQFSLDGVVKFTYTRAVSTNSVMKYLKIYQDFKGSLPVCVIDNVKLFNRSIVEVSGLTQGMFVEIYASSGAFVDRRRASSSIVSFYFNQVDIAFMPHGNIIVRNDTGVIELVDSYREIWGGDCYVFSMPELLRSAVARTSSGIDTATTTALDDSIDTAKYDTFGDFNFVSDYELVMSGSMYHHDNYAAGVEYHGYQSKTGVYPTDVYVPSYGYFIQFAYLQANAVPIELGLRYYSTAYGWSDMAFWGTDVIILEDGGDEVRAGDMPVPGQWVMLVTKVSDVGWSATYLRGAKFTHLGGDPYYDKTAVTSDSNFGKIQVTGLLAGQKVELRRSNGTLVTSVTATTTSAYLDLYAAGIHCFPLSAYFVFYDTLGQVSYESPVFKDIYPKDVYAFSLANSPFYANSHVPAGYTGLATGTLQYTDAAHTTAMETYIKYGRLSGSTWIENSLVTETKTKDGTYWRATAYEYDQYGNTIKVTDPRGAVMRYSYERLGTYLDTSWMIVATSSPISQQNLSAKFDYYDNGLLKTETDAKGYITSHEYDSVGRLLKTTYPLMDGSLVSVDYSYDNVNQIVTYKDEIDTMIKTYYDSIGRVWKEQRYTSTGTSYSYRTYTYSWNGKVHEITDSLGRSTHVDYDYFGRVVKAYNSDWTALRTSYDDRNRTVSQYDELGNRKDLVYDSVGRLVESSQYLDELSISNTLTYDDVGNLLKVTDCSGLTTTYTYDNMGRLKSISYPYPVNEVFYYDAASRLERVDRSGTTNDLTYQYDDAGRLLKRYYTSNDNVNYTYDPNGNIIYALSASYGTTTVTTRSYDEWNRLEREASTVGSSTYGVSYEYDTRSNVKTIDALDGSYILSYTYDEFNRVKTASLKAGQTTLSLASFSYNTRDQIASISYGNGVTTSFILDPTRGWIDRVYVSKSGASYLDLNYQRDACGRTIQVNSYRTYVYDDLGRLQYANDTSAYGRVSYSYDTYGNRQNTIWNGVTTTYEYDAYKRLYRATTGGSVTNFGYDSLRGDLWSKSASSGTYEFYYTVDDKMHLMRENGIDVGFYAYDAFGRRVMVTEGGVTETTVYSGSSPLVMVSGSGKKTVKTLHVYMNGLHIAKYSSKSAYYFYHQDEVGSVRLVTDPAGAIVFNTDYLPFGESYLPSGQETFMFVDGRSSKYAELICLGARYYDPEVGRFTTPDSVIGSVSTPVTTNRWAYCHNDPINKVDRLGTWPWDNVVNSIVNIGISVVDSTVNLVGDAAEFIVDTVVEIVETAVEIVETAIDVAVDLAEKVVEAARTVCDIVVAGCEAIKVAWDNLDPGLKQWIVMGLSVAASIALPGIGGILVSCLIDGTFIDMMTAMRTGDWAMLGMCALAFIPGGNALKGLKAAGGLGKFLGKGDDLIRIRHYTNAPGKEIIEKSGHLKKGSYVTSPSEIRPGMNQRQIESALEIAPGKGEYHVDLLVSRSSLKIPDSGPLTSGGLLQWQITEDIPLGTSVFVP